MSSQFSLNLDQVLGMMWRDYCELNPAAYEIYRLISDLGEPVVNDHIALRTFNHPRLGIESLARAFRKFGYQEKDDYKFEEKKLYAKYFSHSNLLLPKVFISEILLEKISPFAQKTLTRIAEGIPETILRSDSFSVSGRNWPLDIKTYHELAHESEYSSWVAAFGFRPNHFTMNVNSLVRLNDLAKLNQLLQQHGYSLNSLGGVIKGSPALRLEQSSTMAKNITVKFDDGILEIPGCYYEFAKRYPLPDGTLYQGFVASSADKIFESTNKNSSKITA